MKRDAELSQGSDQLVAWRNQAGIALPGVLFILIGMMSILSVGAIAAINTQRVAVRDAESKSARARSC